jgi:asparagine synthase (glutamine-hydrolysing)
MLEASGAGPGNAATRFTEDTDALLAAEHPRGNCDAAESAVWRAVIEGYFRFTDATLAATAATAGPAQALIAGLRERGTDVLKSLNGTFSLAVWDGDKRELLIATDRFGVRPVVYVPTPNGLVFASDARGLPLHPDVRVTLDPKALYDFLYFTAIPSPNSVWRGVRRLEPAQYLVWRDGQCGTGRYWLPTFTDGSGDVEALNRELHEVLAEAVAWNDLGRNAGAFLSGGLDSSTVAGLLAGHQGSAANTFTIGFDAAGYDEIAYARIAAKHFGNTPHEYYVTPRDVAESIDRIAHAYDEPFGNSSAVPTYYCARLAAQSGVSVMLAGDGGDEIFAGNERYAKQKVFETWFRLPCTLRRTIVEPLTFGFPFGEHLFPVRKLRRYIEQARVPLPDRLQTYNFLHLTPHAEIFTPAFLRDVDPERPLALLREEYHRVEADPVDRMLYLDWRFTLADNDLRKVTVMCEQAGIEVRFPMLDNGVVEFSTRVSPALKLPGFKLRHFYREAMRGFLPEDILAKRKHGFGLPFGVWLATSPELMAVADACFAGIAKRDIFRPAYLEDLLRRHRTEHAGFYGTMVWLIVVMEKWLTANRM